MLTCAPAGKAAPGSNDTTGELHPAASQRSDPTSVLGASIDHHNRASAALGPWATTPKRHRAPPTAGTTVPHTPKWSGGRRTSASAGT
ncbi:MAG: hypothetical protein RL071_4221 [Pseudomonadota bacterium]|jgi:hypothetical protein